MNCANGPEEIVRQHARRDRPSPNNPCHLHFIDYCCLKTNMTQCVCFRTLTVGDISFSRSWFSLFYRSRFCVCLSCPDELFLSFRSFPMEDYCSFSPPFRSLTNTHVTTSFPSVLFLLFILLYVMESRVYGLEI